MNYAEMSDFEINKLVTKHLLTDGWKYNEKEKGFIFESDGDFYRIYDYCNDPEESWSIVDDIFSTLVSIGKYDDGIGFGEREMTIWQAQIHKNNCGKLRAAMIVFLMMNEDK